MKNYEPKKIEEKWQKKWEEQWLYKTQDFTKKKKFYVLDMFPYPSGDGLHVGHPKGYIATDVVSRFKILQGYEVLHPMGWDAFGLPAENYAIKNKVHPREAVEKNIKRFKRQLENIGFTYDWSREINTTDPDYYKWTQWIFLKMFEKGLAYESNEPINWCPSCKTGLANEDLEDGKCERCGSEIEKKHLRQWVLKMTDYADRLLEDLDLLDWEPEILEQQRNWIGRSEGASIKFQIQNSKNYLEVFTTRPDTLFGCTYMVVCPEHEIIRNLKLEIKNFYKVEEYITEAKRKSDIQRTESKEKTGVKLDGLMAINPANNEEIPIYVADYVLSGYGTGAIMAVPAHDERDFEFAKKCGLPIREVVAPYLKDTPRSDKGTENRDVVTAIVKNPKNNKYLCLNWKTTEWKSFPTGGIDGDDLAEAAKREVAEETGYKNLRFIKQIGGPIFAEFYRPHKDSNVFAHFKYLLFELQSEEREKISEKERNQHETIWVDEDKVVLFINVWNQKLTWKRYTEGDFAYSGEGININSGFLNGLKTKEAKEGIIRWLEEKGFGKKAVNYKMRDWVFSRQRYWGEPIPIVHCDKCGIVPVPEEDLPVELPDVERYEPTGTGESPLAGIENWVKVKCPKCGEEGRRETNTMPQWAGSCWYYLRYIDPRNDKTLVDAKKEKIWMPVDLYVGGAEHATRHLLYARFWHKFLYDIGVVSTKEPFNKLFHVGLILAEDGKKMSKRYGTVVNPDDMIEKYGADSLRLYEMFMGPFSQAVAWSTDGLKGVKRFLDKVWNLREKMTHPNPSQEGNSKIKSLVHKTVKKITEDIENFKFNTAISAMMILVNEMEKASEIALKDYKLFILILSPFAPHMCEEIWALLHTPDPSLPAQAGQEGNSRTSIFQESWPAYDPKLAKDEEIEFVVQINGKVRDKFTASADISEEDAKKQALERDKIKEWVNGKEIVKVIFVKGKLVNIVVK